MRVKKSIFEKLLSISDNPEHSLKKSIAKEIFCDDFQSLLDDSILVHFKNLQDIEVVDGEHEYIAEILRRDGKNMYFSPADGWVAVMEEDITLYKINLDWIIRQIMNALDIADRHQPKEILEDSIWAIGLHRLEKLNINLIIVRNIKQNSVLNSLIQYLNNYHKGRDPALVITLDRHLPEYFQLPNQNEVIRIDEAIKWDKDRFELNTHILCGKMGGITSKPGFSGGYRTLISNGETYKFTPIQSEALEFMDNENKAIHQSEILSHTTSEEGTKLRALFKGKGGKIHDAWGSIIKSDRNGNYWLEY